MKAGWLSKKLGDLLSVQNGYAFDSKAFGADGFPLIRIRDLKEGVTTETKFSAAFDSKYIVNAGDFLIGMDGDFTCHEWKGPPAVLNQRVCRLQGFSDSLEPRFLFYGINAHLKAIEEVTGYTTVKHLSSKQILDIEMVVPPHSEQRRIVTLLDEAFADIATAKANAEKNRQNARALYRSVASDLFSDHATGWPNRTLDQLATNLDSKRIPITKSDRRSGEYPYYGASGIVDYVDGYIFDGDHLLISEDGANLLARSTPIAFPASGKYWVNNHAHILKFDDMATQKFVELYLESIPLDEYITGAAQPKLNQKALNSIPIPIPESTTAQQSIVERLFDMQEQCDQLATIHEQKLTALDDLKKSLLHQAFSGQL